MARSNKTAQEMLAMAPADAMSQASCVAFFAECARWADIERFEQIKETAWFGLKTQDRLCKRNDLLMTLKSQLQAIIDITCQEDPEPPTPKEPDITNAEFLPDPDGYYDYPIKGQRATSPDIDDMPALPTT